MDWLKEILGEELFEKFVEKINAFNGDEKNKDKQIKLANLSTGEYVGKGKYDSLETEHNSKLAELKSANELIAEMKKGNKGNEELQSKITDYETKITSLQEELNKSKLESAIKVALLEAKASDIEYMTFKLKEKGELSLDENGHIKGIEEKIIGLKTQFPNQFENGIKKVIENKLPNEHQENEPYSKSDILKMPYNQRVKLFEENPEAFNNAFKQE